MGNYRIVIEGVGPHHNPEGRREGDADQAARAFVEGLRAKGHTVERASMVVAGPVVDGKPSSKKENLLADAAEQATKLAAPASPDASSVDAVEVEVEVAEADGD